MSEIGNPAFQRGSQGCVRVLIGVRQVRIPGAPRRTEPHTYAPGARCAPGFHPRSGLVNVILAIGFEQSCVECIVSWIGVEEKAWHSKEKLQRTGEGTTQPAYAPKTSRELVFTNESKIQHQTRVIEVVVTCSTYLGCVDTCSKLIFLDVNRFSLASALLRCFANPTQFVALIDQVHDIENSFDQVEAPIDAPASPIHPFTMGMPLEDEQDQLSQLSDYVEGMLEHRVDQIQLMVIEMKREQKEKQCMMIELVSLMAQFQTQHMTSTPNPLGSNSSPPPLPSLSHSGTSHVQTSSSPSHNVNPTLESNPFRVESKNKVVPTILDNGSQKNLIAVDVVKELGLETMDHSNPNEISGKTRDESD
eukprot:Gb_07824 [translate_table: standard]